jgi:hypothetical protein
MFPRPWEEQQSPADRERSIWEALILHYEAFRQGITASDEEMEKRINSVLSSQQQPITRSNNPEAYARWVKETLGEDVHLFENQMRYLLEIDLLNDRMRASFPVAVTEPEMQEEFLNEQNHVGGDYVLFETKEDAEAFYERMKAPGRWEAEKAKDSNFSKPFSLITLEAIIDLWGVSQEQIYAFHALEPGSVGPPMPFGTTQWGVFRLLEKRTGDLQDFTTRRDAYYEQIKVKKQYEALKRWIDELKASAALKILPLNP